MIINTKFRQISPTSALLFVVKKYSGFLQLLPLVLSNRGAVDLVTFDFSFHEVEERVLVDLDEVVDLAERTFLLVFLSHGAHSEMTVNGLEDNRSVKYSLKIPLPC